MAHNPLQSYSVKFAPGGRIFTEGDIGTTMFVVQSGQIRLFRIQEGRNKTLGTMEKGDFFGEMSVLEGLPRTTSAEAIDECELIEINSMTFDRMIRGNIEIAVRMLRKLSIRLREAERTIETLQKQPLQREADEPAHRVVAQPAAVSTPPPLTHAALPPGGAPLAVSGPPSSQGRQTLQLQGSSRAPAPVDEQGAPTVQASASVPAPSLQGPPLPRPAATGAHPTPASRALKRGPRLVNETGDVVFSLGERESLIGRYDPVTETQPEVDLTPVDIKRSVSRRHARITVANGNFFLVEEVGALNGTFINGTRLVSGRPTPLKDGDSLGLGTVKLIFRL